MSARLTIDVLPVLRDNFVFVGRHAGGTFVVDAGEAAPVLRHRMALNFAARRDMNVEDIIRKLIARIG